MADQDFKRELHYYLQRARDAMLWKLDGLSEYDARRPLVPTGNNLLGLVKHLAYMEFGYFGDTFGRPSPDEPPLDESDPSADMFATPAQSREFITGLYQKAWAHADATIEALPLEATGHVPWWPADRAEPSLHRVLVHMTAETHRHAGHADILRELIDGAAGLQPNNSNLAYEERDAVRSFYDKVERAAAEAAARSTG